MREDTAERMRGLYDFRLRRFDARAGIGSDRDDAIEQRSRDYQRLRRALLDAERESARELRREGAIDDDVLRRIEYDLDLEDARLDA